MGQTKKSSNSSSKAKTTKKANQTKDKKNKVGIILGAVVLVGVLAFGGIYLGVKAAVDKIPEDTICNNVYVDEMNLSGMKEDEAKELIASKLAEYQALTVDLIAEEAKVQVTLTDLGFGLDNGEEVLEKALFYGKKGSVWER